MFTAAAAHNIAPDTLQRIAHSSTSRKHLKQLSTHQHEFASGEIIGPDLSHSAAYLPDHHQRTVWADYFIQINSHLPRLYQRTAQAISAQLDTTQGAYSQTRCTAARYVGVAGDRRLSLGKLVGHITSTQACRTTAGSAEANEPPQLQPTDEPHAAPSACKQSMCASRRACAWFRRG